MTFKKVFPYLLLNILVSAVTMLAVILIWNAFHPSVNATDRPNGLTTGPVKTSVADLPPLDQKTVEIQSVFMPSELNYEKLSLKNTGTDPIDLSGWSLTNAQGEKFIFPTLTLYPNGGVDIYSKAGVNTAVELFWNGTHSFWKSGETAVLSDSAGDERSSYLIP
jgi:hypothetical protein